MCPSFLNSINQIKVQAPGMSRLHTAIPALLPRDDCTLLNGHSTAVCHLIHLKPQPYPKQVTALSRHLYPCGDGGARSSWVECLEVMTLDFFRGQPAARMIVLTDSFLLDPSQLSRRREVRVSGDPDYHKSGVGKGDSWVLYMFEQSTFQIRSGRDFHVSKEAK